jgi:hypothetical protein
MGTNMKPNTTYVCTNDEELVYVTLGDFYKTDSCGDWWDDNGHQRTPIWLDCFKEYVEDDTKDSANVVTRPSHYTRFIIEPITFIMKNKLGFEIGNVIKYVCRAGGKIYDGMDQTQSEITDLEKAKRYIDMRINLLKGEEIL